MTATTLSVATTRRAGSLAVATTHAGGVGADQALRCRACGQTAVDAVFCDLGGAPPSNRFLRHEDLTRPEPWLPLRTLVCRHCRLVQVDQIADAALHRAIFNDDYAYFSSYSSAWLAHACALVERACARLGLGGDDFVLEVASNDGYLLRYVVERGLRCLGVEPTANTAAVARARGVPTEIAFFDLALAQRLAARHGRARWIAANNVLAHVPDPNPFVAGLAAALHEQGALTLEFPHLVAMVRERQFDTIYHEHFSYFSLLAAERLLARHGLAVWDVEQLPTHGGSLRLWVAHAAAQCAPSAALERFRAEERALGVDGGAFYTGFQRAAEDVKNAFVGFLLQARAVGKTVAAYGAAAKGNTLLNFAGVRSDLLACVADASPHKQGRYLPGSRIPVVAPEHLDRLRPDYIVLLPWNLEAELTARWRHAAAWGARLVVAVPRLRVIDPAAVPAEARA
ncbi:MAG: methyltransferase domain-containing protein [Betaproteobacteria bacterium]